MTTAFTAPVATGRSTGRAWFWAGIGVCLLGVALFFVQFSLKLMFVPWYVPALASVGALLLLVAVARRRSIVRIATLLLLAAFAGLQWHFLVVLMKLPSYDGPAQPDKPFPAFQSTLANGKPFTEEDLQDKSRRAMVFFRGRW
jgi:hypothetical protein